MLSVLIFIIPLICCGQTADHDEAVAALMKFYDESTGLWNTTGWWNSANCLTSVIDYMILNGTKQYLNVIENTYTKSRNHGGAVNFTNEFVDDVGWWGLAWVRAYDLTQDRKYLEMAQLNADYMNSYNDSVCNGGLYWKTDRYLKNAIENELYIKLAASLHNRIAGDTKNLAQAKQVWEWFNATGLINSERLVHDGLDNKTCKPVGQANLQTWTYNQGVILGGLEQLYKATNNSAYLDTALAIANSATNSSFLNPNGILKEPEETDDCGKDGPSFKGIFVRNLGELSRTLKNGLFRGYLTKLRDSAVANDKNNASQYGNHWAGPFKEPGAACQHGAVDLLNAANYI